jgi:hypothetical protein
LNGSASLQSQEFSEASRVRLPASVLGMDGLRRRGSRAEMSLSPPPAGPRESLLAYVQRTTPSGSAIASSSNRSQPNDHAVPQFVQPIRAAPTSFRRTLTPVREIEASPRFHSAPHAASSFPRSSPESNLRRPGSDIARSRQSSLRNPAPADEEAPLLPRDGSSSLDINADPDDEEL